jgi:hypothetical protein
LGASFDRMGNFQIHYPFSFLWVWVSKHHNEDSFLVCHYI